MAANGGRVVLAPQDTDEDPHDWPDSVLLDLRGLVSMLGHGTHTIRRAPDFPQPTPLTNERGYPTNYWRVGDVRHWEKTHCIYGSQTQSCTRPRAGHDPEHLALCDTHRTQALRILNPQKDPN